MKSLLAAMSVHLPTIVFRRTGRKHNQTTSRTTNIDTSVIQKPDTFAFPV